MRAFSGGLLLAIALAIGAAPSVHAQAPPTDGIGDQVFATGGDITIEVRRATGGLTSELRLYNDDGSFTSLARNTESGRIITLPARPMGSELVFGIVAFYTSYSSWTFKTGPASRNPDNLPHARVKQVGEAAPVDATRATCASDRRGCVVTGASWSRHLR